jgi:hypothetical protein
VAYDFTKFCSVQDATERSLKNAKHLRAINAGPVAALLALAQRIDVLIANQGSDESGRLDNVSIPTYLKYCQALGLTPEPDVLEKQAAQSKPKSAIERFMEAQAKKADEPGA